MAEIEVFRARNTTGLAINGTRVTETKPYGLIQTTQKFKADDEEITKALRIDVQPVKHGYWEEVTDYGGWGDTHYRCSVCSEEWYLEDGKPKDNNMNFCPRCGAKMDLNSVTHDRCSNYMDCDGRCEK